MARATVHLLRHGLVHNPDGILYGRLPDFHLSEVGQKMAERMAEYTADFDIVHFRCSPLERARETMEPVSRNHEGVEVVIDDRVIEASNKLQGRVFSASASSFADPRVWWHLRNPLRPSWGEPYQEIVARMHEAILDAAAQAEGHEALIVSHQLPIWMARLAAEGRALVHDPRKRECSLASLTSFAVEDGRITQVSYADPCADLVPAKKGKKFVAGA